jgi:hypothetical protein
MRAEIRSSMATMASPLALPEPSGGHFLTTASVRESTAPDRLPSGLGFLSLAPDSRCGSLDPPIAASCNADSTNRSNIKLEAHRLKCVATTAAYQGLRLSALSPRKSTGMRRPSPAANSLRASWRAGRRSTLRHHAGPARSAAASDRLCVLNFAGVCARIPASVWCRSALAIRRATVLAGLGHDCSTFFGVIPNRLSLFACRYPQITYATADLRFSLVSKDDSLIAPIHSLFCCSKFPVRAKAIPCSVAQGISR